MQNKNWLGYLVVLILIISLVNLAFNLKFVLEFMSEKNKPQPLTVSGVIPRPPGSEAVTMPPETVATNSAATESGTLLGEMSWGETATNSTPTPSIPTPAPNLTFNAALTTTESKLCQWPQSALNISTALIKPDKQLLTLADTKTAKTYKLLKNQNLVYVWEEGGTKGFRFETRNAAIFRQHAITAQLPAGYLAILELATGTTQPSCENSEINNESLSLPQTVGFEQIPAQEL